MNETQPATAQGAAGVPQGQGNSRIIARYIAPGLVLGAATGLWVANSDRVLSEETTVLSAAAGADVALLALTLGAMAFVIALLDGEILGDVIEFYGVQNFFFPFKFLAFVSAAAAIVSFAGALDNGTGPPKAQDALFAAAAWLTVWAIVAAVGLVWILVFYADQRRVARENLELFARPRPSQGGGGTAKAKDLPGDAPRPD